MKLSTWRTTTAAAPAAEIAARAAATAAASAAIGERAARVAAAGCRGATTCAVQGEKRGGEDQRAGDGGGISNMHTQKSWINSEKTTKRTRKCQHTAYERSARGECFALIKPVAT